MLFRSRQGNDIGSQYRSVIFYHNEEQKKLAEEVKLRVEAEKIYTAPIVTEITTYTAFYPAESYHQNYYEKNPDQPYCQLVISPKLVKFREKFSKLLKR